MSDDKIMMDNESRSLIDQYPLLVRQNIDTIKKMTLVFVQKVADIIRLKYSTYSSANQIMVSDALFSYFKHYLAFTNDPEMINFVLYSIRNVRINKYCVFYFSRFLCSQNKS